jgi:hypothetical protein
MARLSQASMSVADTDKITISMMARVNSLAGATLYDSGSFYYVPLLEFGDFSDNSSYSTSGIWLRIGSDLSSMELNFAVAGRPNSIDYANCMSGNWQQNNSSNWTDAFDWVDGFGSHHVNAGVWNSLTTQGASWLPRSSLAVQDSGVLQVGKWVHIFITFDTSIQSEATGILNTSIISGPTCNCVLSGVDEGPFLPEDTRGHLVPNRTALEAVVDLTGITDLYDIQATADQVSRAWPAAQDTGSPGGSGTPDPHPGGIVQFIVPAFNIATSGMKIGLPGVFFANSIVDLYNVQGWFGQAISPTPTNLSKFVTLLPGGHGQSVKDTDSIKAAKAAFGTQSFAFGGKKSKFFINQGSMGAFSLTGTINDISAPRF